MVKMLPAPNKVDLLGATWIKGMGIAASALVAATLY